MVGFAGAASAQNTVPLPDQSQSTELRAIVNEQARINVPAIITFNVASVAAVTNANADITIDNIVLSSATRTVRVSVQANAAAFTPPAGGGNTWSAGDVSWAAGTWSGGAGVAGTLSNSAFNQVANSNAGVSALSVTGLQFSLAANPLVNRAGTHTLTMTWRVEAL
jgi:hypothetical protein